MFTSWLFLAWALTILIHVSIKRTCFTCIKCTKWRDLNFVLYILNPYIRAFIATENVCANKKKKWALKIQCLCIKFTFNFISFDRRQTQSGAHIFGKHVSQLTPFSSYYLVWIVQTMVNTWCTISKWVPKKGQGNFEERCIYLVLSGL